MACRKDALQVPFSGSSQIAFGPLYGGEAGGKWEDADLVEFANKRVRITAGCSYL